MEINIVEKYQKKEGEGGKIKRNKKERGEG
jgi:hypothetical protein